MSISHKEAETIINEDKKILAEEKKEKKTLDAILNNLKQEEKIVKNTNSKFNVIFVFIILLLVAFAFWAFSLINLNKEDVGEQYRELASCLSANDVVLYGTSWCQYCNTQKKMFGSAYELINYVECSQNEQLCFSKGVVSSPTWIKGEEVLNGLQQLADLAVWAGCEDTL